MRLDDVDWNIDTIGDIGRLYPLSEATGEVFVR
jgi:hypothetical protein